jgi:hypothetical protein
MTVLMWVLAMLSFRHSSLEEGLPQNPPLTAAVYQNPPQSKSQIPAAGADQSSISPQCAVTGAKEITIVCSYSPARDRAVAPKGAARIVLNRAKLAFETDDESYMLVELEFTNVGRSSLGVAPTVFLAIDEAAGRNVLRRNLHHVDLSKLGPSEHLTFSDRFLVGAFLGGQYTVSLSIPDPDASRKNIPAYNMLLSSSGVPDPSTGLNILAHFSVEQAMHSSRKK